METMILVAGLAVAGLAGIAAAFYFSMRPGSSRDPEVSQPQPKPRRSQAREAWTADQPARSSRSGRADDHAGSSTMIDLTGPQRRLADTGPQQRSADTGPRRRMAWRKGADVDEELWPAEAFGGVSDEQFWDDLAADKPLATTARTAQPDGGARMRRPNAGPLPELRPGDSRTEMRPIQAATQPSPNATQPVRAAYPAAALGGAGLGPDDDPLTSPAYSLRPKARSHQSSRRSDLTREQYEAATSQDTQTFSLAETQAATGGYPGGVPPFRQFDQPARGNGLGRSDSLRPDPLAPNGYRTDPLRTDPPRTDPLRTDPPRPTATAVPAPMPHVALMRLTPPTHTLRSLAAGRPSRETREAW
jgi:hypothetical protein